MRHPVSARAYATRVALVATAILAGVYVCAATVLDVVIVDRLTAQVDAHLGEVLESASRHPTSPTVGATEDSPDVDDAPTLMWIVPRGSAPRSVGANELELPVGDVPIRPSTIEISGRSLRVASLSLPSGDRLVVGQSLSRVDHVRSVLVIAEVVLAPFILLGTFGIALVIGRKSVEPVEQMRQRQLEFTADASHELRTPLSVVTAEIDLALDKRRAADEYEAALGRIGAEADRLRRIVRDMLWLARFDATPEPGPTEAVDAGAAVRACVDRFAAVAEARGIRLTCQTDPHVPTVVRIAPDWLERLLGVLVDNGLRYVDDGGEVQVRVDATRSVVRIAVDDDGPGIPESDRSQIFNRFHRASSRQGGAGLGLAIADAIVGSSSGRWTVETSPLGGARFEVALALWRGSGR